MSSIIETEIDEVNFSFDELDIIGVMDGRVFVVGWYLKEVEGKEDDCEFVKCLLAFDRHLFHIALDHWLNDKERLCELWGHFCGVMGRIICTNFTKLKGEFFIHDVETEKDVDIEAFQINYVEPGCDMEHG